MTVENHCTVKLLMDITLPPLFHWVRPRAFFFIGVYVAALLLDWPPVLFVHTPVDIYSTAEALFFIFLIESLRLHIKE
jgi:hypothetical protein